MEMVKIQHTVFALPFALMSALAAANGQIPFETLFWILVAMVGARSSAMTFNRIVDRRIDAINPRTANRAVATGEISVASAFATLLIATGFFILAAAMLNRLALLLSPVALIVIWGYSLTKRFTQWSHLFLGLSLGIAPVGAWIAVRGEIGWPSVWLAAAVLTWVAGFDIIYSLQDIEFDRKQGLHSIPARVGPGRALMISALLHGLSVVFLSMFGYTAGLNAVYWIGVVVAAGLLWWEHTLVQPDDITRVDAAFFTVNGYVSICLFLFTAVAVYTGAS
ncbi:MAG: UbiA family prenyltransferase [Chthonomonadales bacterium]|nr:UbiA family prenyltransferase [Chthonomonadales bacterium]